MTTTVAPRPHRGWVLAVRIALFALSGYFILDSIRTGAFRQFLEVPIAEDLMATLIGIITSGLGAGILLLILALAAGPVTRRRGGWLLLALTTLGAVCPIAGFGLIFGLAGGDQMTSLGGLGFLLILLGTPLFFVAYVWAVVFATVVVAKERRERRSLSGPAAPTRTL